MTDCGKSENKGCLKAVKIGCLSIVALFLIVVLAVAGWFFYVTREVKVHDEDLVVTFENVPDEENGYFALGKARKELEESGFDTDALCVTNDIPSDENLEVYRLFVKEHPNVLSRFYSVAGYKHCRCPIDEGVPMFEQDIMPVASLYLLGNLSLCNIEFLIQEGHQEEALGALVAHMRIGQMIQNDANKLVSGVLGLVIHNQSLKLLVCYLSQGVFSETQLPALNELVVILQDGSDWKRMAKAEYSSSKEICASTVDAVRANFPSITPARMVKVFYNETRTLKPMARYYYELLESFGDPDVQVRFPVIDTEKFSALDWLRLYVSGNIVGPLIHAVTIPSIINVNRTVSEQRSRVGLVELYLASWKYYDEQGELPDELNQLVPEYLSELPVDPYGKGAGFLYDPAKNEIYSAGVERSEKQDDLKISLGFAE